MSLVVDVLLMLIPFILGIMLLIIFRLKADTVGVVIFVSIILLAIFYFKTDWKVSLLASLAGIIKSFPISLMVLTSILMMTYMEKTGALAKIVVSFKKIGGGNKAFQIMIINLALGTFLVSIGATPVTMLPPILAAMGYSSFAAVALPTIGYDPLCTYALLAVPASFFADFMGITLTASGIAFSYYMPLITTGIGLGMLWLAGGRKLLFSKDGLTFSLIGGLTAGCSAIVSNQLGIVTLTGVIAGIVTALALIFVAKLKKIKIIDSKVLTEKEKETDRSMSLVRALSPWLILIVFVSVTNLIPTIFNYLKNEISLPITLQGSQINTSPFSHAYFWVLIATLGSIPFLGWKKTQLKETLKVWSKRSVRPVFAAAIFFAIAFVMINSGRQSYPSNWSAVADSSTNMIKVLSEASAIGFGKFYPLIVPFIGLFGGFISGSETSAIAMFTSYHQQTAMTLGISALAVGTANGIGGGLASVLSPAKIQNAAAVIDKVGIEGEVIKKTAPIAILMTLSVAVICNSWANNYPWWLWILSFIALLLALEGIAGILILFDKRKKKKSEKVTKENKKQKS